MEQEPFPRSRCQPGKTMVLTGYKPQKGKVYETKKTQGLLNRDVFLSPCEEVLVASLSSPSYGYFIQWVMGRGMRLARSG